MKTVQPFQGPGHELHGTGDAIDINAQESPFFPTRAKHLGVPDPSAPAFKDPSDPNALVSFQYGGEKHANLGGEADHIADVFDPVMAALDRACQVILGVPATMQPTLTRQGRNSFVPSPRNDADLRAKLSEHATSTLATWDDFHSVHVAMQRYFQLAFPATKDHTHKTLPFESPPTSNGATAPAPTFTAIVQALSEERDPKKQVLSHPTALRIDVDILAAAKLGDVEPPSLANPPEVVKTVARVHNDIPKLDEKNLPVLEKGRPIILPNTREITVRKRDAVDLPKGLGGASPEQRRAVYLQIVRDHSLIRAGMVNGSINDPKKSPPNFSIARANGGGTMVFRSLRDPCNGFLHVEKHVVAEFVRQGFAWLGGSVAPQFDFSGDMMHVDLRRHTGSPDLELAIRLIAFRKRIKEAHGKTKASAAAVTAAETRIASAIIAARTSIGKARADAAAAEKADASSGSTLSSVDPDLETLVQDVLADCQRAEDTANTLERAAARAQDVVKKADDKAADIDARRKQLITEPDADREAKDAEAQATKAETTSKAVSSKDKNAETVEKAGASLSSASSGLASVARKLSDAATPVKKTQKAADVNKLKSLKAERENVSAAVGKAQGEANASEAAGSSL